MLSFSDEDNSFRAIHLPIWFEYFDGMKLPGFYKTQHDHMILRSTLSHKFWTDLDKKWQDNTI